MARTTVQVDQLICVQRRSSERANRMSVRRFKGCKIFYDVNYLDGCLKLFRGLLSKRYPTYDRDGFEAFKQTIPVIYYNSPSTFIVAQYLCYCVSHKYVPCVTLKA